MATEQKAKPLLIRAAYGEDVERTPIWIMRQAGRYLPEYRKVREKTDFLTLCKTPELAAEVSSQPIERFGLDAAIIFSDILIPLESMGLPIAYPDGGPKIEKRIESAEDVAKLRVARPDEDAPYLGQAIKILQERIGEETPVIGFAGAPFTMAAYAIEGGGGKGMFHRVRRFINDAPEAYEALAEKITETTIHWLTAQVEAGAQAVQLFDTWAGVLSKPDYAQYALPYCKRIFAAIDKLNVPRTIYINGVSPLLELVGESGADVLSVDWRLPMDEIIRRISFKQAVQGNLDPALLASHNREALLAEAASILIATRQRGRHIFNLGHGILPETPVEQVQALVEFVQGYGDR